MAVVEFIYNGIPTTVQCYQNDTLNNILNKLSTKIEIDLNSIYIIHSGEVISNYNLTFEQIANSDDKYRNKMNILIQDKGTIFSKAQSNYNYNIPSINNNNIKQPYGPIYETLNEYKDRIKKIEGEITDKSDKIKIKIEELKNKLIQLDKKQYIGSTGIYYGQIQYNKANGLGINEEEDNKYEGEWLNGVRNGFGITYYNDDSIHMGEYRNNSRHGFGIEENLDYKYEGYYINDTWTGNGIYTCHKYGYKYIGQYYKGKSSGFGKYVWPNGDYFIGECENDEKKKGISYFHDDKGLFDATWEMKKENNEFVGKGKGIYYLIDGNYYNRIRVIKNGQEKFWQNV